jgi:hypothetical protein
VWLDNPGRVRSQITSVISKVDYSSKAKRSNVRDLLAAKSTIYNSLAQVGERSYLRRLGTAVVCYCSLYSFHMFGSFAKHGKSAELVILVLPYLPRRAPIREAHLNIFESHSLTPFAILGSMALGAPTRHLTSGLRPIRHGLKSQAAQRRNLAGKGAKL